MIMYFQGPIAAPAKITVEAPGTGRQLEILECESRRAGHVVDPIPVPLTCQCVKMPGT